jgi:hypothetical protein
MIRYVEGGPLLLGIQFPEMLGLSGLALGVIIVGFMIWRPNGLMANLELDEVLKQHQKLGRWLQPRKLVLDGDVSPQPAKRDGETRQN